MLLDTIYLICAVAGGTILLCQFALALFGLGHDGSLLGDHASGDFSGDAHGGDFGSHHGSADDAAAHPDSTHLFAVVSFRTLVTAAAFFGVTGMATRGGGLPATTTLVLSIVAGAVAMYAMYGLLRLIAGLSSSGNEHIGNAVGLTATVYVSIPAASKGAGKVQLSMQNRIVEYQAVTDDAEPLKTGETVDVVGILNSDTVQVRRALRSALKQPAAV
jgi:hypothetical protein